MADDLKYGYKGAEPTQSFGNNTGVFDPNDINNLIADNKWTNYGQLELIETQTITTSTSGIDFTNLQGSTYNVHFLTYNDLQVTTDGATVNIRFSNDGGSSFETSNYDQATQEGRASGSFFEISTTVGTNIRLNGNAGTGTNEKENGYIYFYNLNDSSKYSIATYHNSNFNRDPSGAMSFGSGVYHQAETINAVRLRGSSGNIDNAVVSLYGIKEYS